MEIIAGSQPSAAESFLHAGYISAHPRKMEGYTVSSFVNENTELIVVSDALQLKNEASLKVVPKRRTMPASLPSNSLALTTGGVALFFSLLLATTWLKQRPKARFAIKWMGVLALCIGAIFIGACFRSTKPSPTPAAKAAAEKREYVNPELATKTILYAIIGDALPNVKGTVKDLGRIHKEVGLPTKDLSPGETYALKMYTVDGWGREFRLQNKNVKKTLVTVVTSAGQDGQFDTADDMSIEVERRKYDWEYDRKGIYVQRTDGESHLILHRSTNRLFRYHDQKLAKELTGSYLYDVIPQKELSKDNKKKLDGLVGDKKGLIFLCPGKKSVM